MLEGPLASSLSLEIGVIMVDVPTMRYVHSTGYSTFVQLQHFRFMQFMAEYKEAHGLRVREREGKRELMSVRVRGNFW